MTFFTSYRPNYDRRGYPPSPMRGADYDPMFDNAIYGEYAGPSPGRGYPSRGMPPPPPPGKEKCNLTLAMSPTCHCNNALLICRHVFFLECSQ